MKTREKPRKTTAFALMMGSALLLAASAARAETLDYAGFLARVKAHHPAAATDRATLGLAEGAGRGVGRLPDPQLSVAREDVGTDAAGWRVTLSQTLPWPGTLGAASDAADAAKDAAKASVTLAQLARELDAGRVFLALTAKTKLAAVQRESLAEIRKIVEFAGARFKQGLGSHTEYVQAYTDSHVLQANLAALDAEIQGLEDEARAMAGAPDLQLVKEFPKDGTAPDARDARAELYASTEKEGLARREYARKQALPSLTVAAMMMREDEGMEGVGGMVGVTLPLYSGARRDGIAQEADALRERTAGESAWYAAQKRVALARVDRAIATIGANLAVMERDVVPFTANHARSALVEYQQGKGSITGVILSRTAGIELQGAVVGLQEALARAKLARGLVAAGLLEAADAATVPQLAPFGLAGSMSGMGGSMGLEDGGMGGMGGGAAKKAPKRAPVAPEPGATDETDAPARSGMGGM